MSSYSVVNNIPAFRVSESFCSIEAQYSMSSGEVTTVSNDDRLFVSAGFASWVRRFGACVCRVCALVLATLVVGVGAFM